MTAAQLLADLRTFLRREIVRRSPPTQARAMLAQDLIGDPAVAAAVAGLLRAWLPKLVHTPAAEQLASIRGILEDSQTMALPEFITVLREIMGERAVLAAQGWPGSYDPAVAQQFYDDWMAILHSLESCGRVSHD